MRKNILSNILPIAALLLVISLLSACSDAPAPTPTAQPQPTNSAAPAQPTDPPPEPTTTSSTAPPAAPAEDRPATGESAPVLANVATVETAAAINSYRVHIDMQADSPRGTDTFSIAGAYVKAPRAEELVVTFLQGAESQEIGMILIDDTRYFLAGDTWVQTTDANFNPDELTLITPLDVLTAMENMDYIGPDILEDRPAYHFRGGKEVLPVMGTEGDTLDVSQLESAQLDVWVDQEFAVVRRFTLAINDTSGERPLNAQITADYFDFNTAITIEAPVLPAEAVPPETSFTPRNELSALLGFNLLFPVGSTVETVVATPGGAQLHAIVAPYTFTEAANLIELTLPANDYTQMSKIGPNDGQIVYLYQKDTQLLTITLEEMGDGSTRFLFAQQP